MDNYAIEVHGLKSDLKYIGFYKISDIYYEHEKASKDNNIEFVNNNFSELISATNNVIDICEKYLGIE